MKSLGTFCGPMTSTTLPPICNKEAMARVLVHSHVLIPVTPPRPTPPSIVACPWDVFQHRSVKAKGSSLMVFVPDCSRAPTWNLQHQAKCGYREQVSEGGRAGVRGEGEGEKITCMASHFIPVWRPSTALLEGEGGRSGQFQSGCRAVTGDEKAVGGGGAVTGGWKCGWGWCWGMGMPLR